MSGRTSRRKGHNFERELVNFFKEKLECEASRGLQSQGAVVPDVLLHFKQFVIWVEAKIGKRPNIKAALEQAERDSGEEISIAITKWDRDVPIVSMRIDSFIKLLKEE